MSPQRHSRLTMLPPIVLSSLTLGISWWLGETAAALLWLIITLVQLAIVVLLEMEYRRSGQKRPVWAIGGNESDNVPITRGDSA